MPQHHYIPIRGQEDNIRQMLANVVSCFPRFPMVSPVPGELPESGDRKWAFLSQQFIDAGSVSEVTSTGEDHRDAMLVAGLNDFFVVP